MTFFKPPKKEVTYERKVVDGTYRIPFGKHKGEKLEDLPDDYLEWLVDNLEPEKYNNAKVIEECQNQLSMRQGQGVARKRED